MTFEQCLRDGDAARRATPPAVSVTYYGVYLTVPAAAGLPARDFRVRGDRVTPEPAPGRGQA